MRELVEQTFREEADEGDNEGVQRECEDDADDSAGHHASGDFSDVPHHCKCLSRDIEPPSSFVLRKRQTRGGPACERLGVLVSLKVWRASDDELVAMRAEDDFRHFREARAM